MIRPFKILRRLSDPRNVCFRIGCDYEVIASVGKHGPRMWECKRCKETTGWKRVKEVAQAPATMTEIYNLDYPEWPYASTVHRKGRTAFEIAVWKET